MERELRLLSRLDIDQDVVVLLLPILALPVQLRRIVRGNLDVRAARENGVLLSPAAAQQQILHAADVVYDFRVHSVHGSPFLHL
jgi:hypothetical protein